MVEMEVHHEAAQPSEALGNKSLFANHFRGSSWAAWKVFLVALTAEPMNTAALALYRQGTDRTAPPTAPFSARALSSAVTALRAVSWP
jgi:hypothetical protein